jgi:restriction system protein
MSEAHHYPPDVMELLVSTIAVLNKYKPSVLLFFEGAGVDERDLRPMRERLAKDPQGTKKAHIARAF